MHVIQLLQFKPPKLHKDSQIDIKLGINYQFSFISTEDGK